jgi:LasA protease
MPSRHRKAAESGPSPRFGSVLFLANRVSGFGMVVVVTVGMMLAVIVEQKMFPVGSVHRHPVAQGPGHAKPRPKASKHRPSPKPVSPAHVLNKLVQQVALKERGPVARHEYGAQKIAAPVVRVNRFGAQHRWAFGTEVIPPPPGATAVPESSLYLAHATGDTWKVALAGAPDFAALLREAPTSVLPGGERTVLERYDASAKSASQKAKVTPVKDKSSKTPADDGLMLPWSAGQSWTLLPAELGSSFDGGDGRVLSAGTGRLYRLCSSSPDHGLVMVIGADGTAAVYYQLDQITDVPDGSLVEQGDYLGRTSTDQPCGGGQAPRRLVRFGLRNVDGPLPLEGVKLGGWTLHQSPAEIFAEHDGLRVEAGNPLLNFGVATSPTPAPSPTHSPTKSPKAPQIPPEGIDDQT